MTKVRQPTELQRKILDRAQDAKGGEPLYRFFGVHHSDQVVSRAINLCCRYGWLRKLRDRELQLTAAGLKALREAQR